MSRQDSANDYSSDEDHNSQRAQEQRDNLLAIEKSELELAKHNTRLRRIARELVSAQARLHPDEGDETREGDEADQDQLQKHCSSGNQTPGRAKADTILAEAS